MNDNWDGISAGLQLDLLDHFPDELLDVPATALWRHLRGPSLFHIAGRQPDPLFVTVSAARQRAYRLAGDAAGPAKSQGPSLPRSLLLFVANIEAAKANVRTLPGQTDYNRTWPGNAGQSAAETRLMTRVFEIVRERAPFCQHRYSQQYRQQSALRLRHEPGRQISPPGPPVQPNGRVLREADRRAISGTCCDSVRPSPSNVGVSAMTPVRPCERVRVCRSCSVAFSRCHHYPRRHRSDADTCDHQGSG